MLGQALDEPKAELDRKVVCLPEAPASMMLQDEELFIYIFDVFVTEAKKIPR